MTPIRRSLLAVTLAAGGCNAARGAPEAWNRVVLVELYTSQGCSSCPPADAVVRDFPRRGLGRDKVVPLAFHVDYWDRLGWPDPFAAPANTRRQEWYAESGRLRPPGGDERASGEITGLYTPQMIVNGQVHFTGGRRGVAEDEIRRAAARPPDADLTAALAPGGDLLAGTVRVAPRATLDRRGDWRLVVALAAREAHTRVLHGENGGDTLVEAAIVRAMTDRIPLALAGGGRATREIRLQKPAGLAWSDVDVVAFVQDERTRAVAAVTTLR